MAGTLTRVHTRSRFGLFSHSMVADCPVKPEELKKIRVTELVDSNGRENVIQDSWDDEWNHKSLGKEWTGKTIFFLKKEDRKTRRYGPSASMAATAFLAERIMTNKNAKKKAAGKVFDFYKCTRSAERNHRIPEGRMEQVEGIQRWHLSSRRRIGKAEDGRKCSTSDTVD